MISAQIAPRVSLTGSIAALGHWLSVLVAGARAGREAGRLSQLSDQRLAEIGIARGDIVRYAFRNVPD